MTVVSRSIYIQALPDKVFAYLADVERHVEWSGKASSGPERVEKVTPGPLRVGSEFKSKGLISSRSGVEESSIITEMEENRRLVWETTISQRRSRNAFRWAHTLEAEGEGTWVTYTLEARRFSPKPLLLWFPPFQWLVDRQIFAREMVNGLQKIKDAVED